MGTYYLDGPNNLSNPIANPITMVINTTARTTSVREMYGGIGVPVINAFPGVFPAGQFTLVIQTSQTTANTKFKSSFIVKRYTRAGSLVETSSVSTSVVVTASTTMTLTPTWVVPVAELEYITVTVSFANTGSTLVAINLYLDGTSILTTPYPNAVNIAAPNATIMPSMLIPIFDEILYLQKLINSVWTPYATIVGNSLRSYLDTQAPWGMNDYRAAILYKGIKLSEYSTIYQINKINNVINQYLDVPTSTSNADIANASINVDTYLIIDSVGDIFADMPQVSIYVQGAATHAEVYVPIMNTSLIMYPGIVNRPVDVLVASVIMECIATVGSGLNITIPQAIIVEETTTPILVIDIVLTAPTTTATTDFPDTYLFIRVMNDGLRLVYSINDLIDAHYDLACDYRQMADIDLGEYNWPPIGLQNAPFTGEYDGNGYIIHNLICIANYLSGLFGWCSSTSVLKNITLIHPQCHGSGYGNTNALKWAGAPNMTYVVAGEYRNHVDTYNIKPTIVGSLCAVNEGTVVNCVVRIFEGNPDNNIASLSSPYIVGGLIGKAHNIYDCRVFSEIELYNSLFFGWCGGLLCGTSDGEIRDCWAGGYLLPVGRVDEGGNNGVEYRFWYNLPIAGPYYTTNFPTQTHVVADGTSWPIEKAAMGGLVGKMLSGSITRCVSVPTFMEHYSLTTSWSGLVYTKMWPALYTTKDPTLDSLGVYYDNIIMHLYTYYPGQNTGTWADLPFYDYLRANIHDIGGLVGWKVSGSIIDSYYSIDTSGQTDDTNGLGKSLAELNELAAYSNFDFKNKWAISLMSAYYDYDVSSIIKYPMKYTANGDIYYIRNGSAGYRNKWGLKGKFKKIEVWRDII